ncbi:MAG: hypothetical protein FWE74_07630 [Oscillospiraceae bacterium]|nr:hypothetical protein [Oscillospiraceae bacterium]
MELITIYATLLTLCIGIISFFVKRAFTQLDKKADKDELKECQKDLKGLHDRFATKEELAEIKTRMDKLDEGIEFLKENTIRKDDFIRLFTRLEKKIDDLN